MAKDLLKDIKREFKDSILDVSEEDGKSTVVVKKESLFDLASKLKKEGFEHFTFVTAVDWKKSFSLIYRLHSIEDDKSVVVKTEVSRKAPKISSVTSLWEGANWQEREIYDLFGIEFLNHPDLRRILLPDDWKGHPLRKDYKDKEIEVRPDYF